MTGNTDLELPEVAFYRDTDELAQREVNLPLLAEITRVTGGSLHPTLKQLLDDRQAWVRERRPLWPYWLVLALLLNFLEVALRKGLLDRWRREPPSLEPTLPAQQQVA